MKFIFSKKSKLVLFLCSFIFSITFCQAQNKNNNNWTIKSQEDWQNASLELSNIELSKGQLISNISESNFISQVKKFSKKTKATSITFKQTDVWNNWKEIPSVGTPDMDNAVVLIPVKNGDYWLLAAYWPEAEFGPRRLPEGKWANDKRPASERGYHAWHSTDMLNWTHHGPVSEFKSKWVTTAEYVDGKFYIYYDNPNDEDPHLIIDEDLYDGKMGKDLGMVFSDPTHGSDCAIFRDEDGTFHLIYENWDHIDAQKHSWDSPVGGHAVSKDGIHDFKILAPAVDDRTTPTGEYGTYIHNPNGKTPLKYEIHTPEQNAYGDWTAIKVGKQYYLFCDYHPAGEQIKIGKWTSNDINKQFSFIGGMGAGHPDPTVGFAEGKFYLIQQSGDVDFISDGPWVNGVEVRVGVDTSGDGKINQWTGWKEVKESYTQKEGFARIVDTKPASLDLSGLPKGYAFQFEYKTHKTKDQIAPVIMESVEFSFE